MGRSNFHSSGPFNQLLFVQDQLCVRHGARCSGYKSEENKNPCPKGVYNLVEDKGNKQSVSCIRRDVKKIQQGKETVVGVARSHGALQALVRSLDCVPGSQEAMRAVREGGDRMCLTLQQQPPAPV